MNEEKTLGELLKTPMGKRLDVFLDDEWRKGRGLIINRTLADQFLRFAQSEVVEQQGIIDSISRTLQERCNDLRELEQSKAQLVKFFTDKNAELRAEVARLKVEPRPFSEAPRDGSKVLAWHRTRNVWVNIRWGITHWPTEKWADAAGTTHWSASSFSHFLPAPPPPTE